MTITGRQPGAFAPDRGRNVRRPVAADPRQLGHHFRGCSKARAKTAHRTRNVYADVIYLRVPGKQTCDGETTCKRAAPDVDDNRIPRTLGDAEQLLERRQEFFEVPALKIVGVEQNTIVGRQVPPRFVEIGVTPAGRQARRVSRIDAQRGSRYRPGSFINRSKTSERRSVSNQSGSIGSRPFPVASSQIRPPSAGRFTGCRRTLRLGSPLRRRPRSVAVTAGASAATRI